MKRKPPRQIIGYVRDPDSYDPLAFETAIRAEVETTTGATTASDELLISALCIQMEAMLEAHTNILRDGPLAQYGPGVTTSPWTKIRNESIDKIIKILGELGLVARGRPKKQNKATEVDELFDPA